jgi:hypothetical protein
MFEEYISSNNNIDTIKLIYKHIDENYGDIIFYPLLIAKNKYIIPKSSIIRKYNETNHYYVLNLLNKKIIAEDLVRNRYVFIRDYDIPKKLSEFSRIFGLEEINPINFRLSINQKNIIIEGIKRGEILKALKKNKIPEIYMKYFDTLSNMFLSCFLNIFLFSGNDINIHNFSVYKINEFLKFYYDWTGNVQWDLGSFYEIKDIQKVDNIKNKINMLYTSGIVNKEHRDKLLKASAKDIMLASSIIDLLDENSNYKTIYSIYTILDNYDDKLNIIEEKEVKCCCLVQ